MRFVPVVLLSILMWVFIVLGFYGLAQQFHKQFLGVPTVIERER